MNVLYKIGELDQFLSDRKDTVDPMYDLHSIVMPFLQNYQYMVTKVDQIFDYKIYHLSPHCDLAKRVYYKQLNQGK